MTETAVPPKRTPLKPHFVSAFYNWMQENDPRVFVQCIMDHPLFDMTPRPVQPRIDRIDIVFNDFKKEVEVISFNLNPEAVSGFLMNKDGIMFKCRMNGTVVQVYIPMESIISLYAPDSKLSEQFLYELDWVFDNDKLVDQSAVKQPEEKPPVKQVSHLKRVK